jgi:hypothetical protein
MLFLAVPNVSKLSGERSGAERVRCSAVLGVLIRQTGSATIGALRLALSN